MSGFGVAGLPLQGRSDTLYSPFQNCLHPSLPFSVAQTLTCRDSVDGLPCPPASSWKEGGGEVRVLIPCVPSSCKVATGWLGPRQRLSSSWVAALQCAWPPAREASGTSPGGHTTLWVCSAQPSLIAGPGIKSSEFLLN